MSLRLIVSMEATPGRINDLIEAYRNVINRSKGLTNNNKFFYFSYVIPQTILKLHNNIKEFN